MKKYKNRNRTSRSVEKLTTLDDSLEQEGKRKEFEAIAIEEVLAWQIAKA